MKLNFQTTVPQYSEQMKNTRVSYSKAGEHSVNFTLENKINKIEHQNVVDSYFKIFDQSFSEVTIKNLIAAKLQPSCELPRVHNTDRLDSKAKELLEFSLAI